MVIEKVAPTWHVLGAGNLGCLWASRLFKHNLPCKLMVRNNRQMEIYPGVHVFNKRSREWDTYPVPCTSIDRVLEKQRVAPHAPKIERLLVCAKSFSVEDAVASVVPALAPNSIVVVLQNGILSPSVEHLLPPETHLFAASTTEGANSDSRFFISPAGHGDTIIGPYSHSNVIPTHELEPPSLLPGAQLVDNIKSVLWRKLLVNCVINPLGALHEVPNGLIAAAVGVENYRRMEREIVSEVIAIARAHGVSLSVDDSLAAVEQVYKATAQNLCSMLQDVGAGKQSEIEALNGFVAREGVRLNIPTPRNRELAERVQALYTV